jgi:hypothetical protein
LVTRPNGAEREGGHTGVHGGRGGAACRRRLSPTTGTRKGARESITEARATCCAQEKGRKRGGAGRSARPRAPASTDGTTVVVTAIPVLTLAKLLCACARGALWRGEAHAEACGAPSGGKVARASLAAAAMAGGRAVTRSGATFGNERRERRKGAGTRVKARSGATLNVFLSRCRGSDQAASHRPWPPVRRGHAARRARGLASARERGTACGVRPVHWTAARGGARARAQARPGWLAAAGRK